MVKDFKLGESFQLGRTKLEVLKNKGVKTAFSMNSWRIAGR